MATMGRLVCVCGPLRHLSRLRHVARHEYSAGNFPLLPHPPLPGASDPEGTYRGQVERADEVVVVVDDTGHVGTAERDVVAYARELGKPVRVVMVDRSDSEVARYVRESQRAFRLVAQLRPSATGVPRATQRLRLRLLWEGTRRLRDAVKAQDVVAVAAGLADIVYVAYGTALAYGVDLDAVMAETHESNMTKLDQSGRAEFDDAGRVLASGQYRSPDVLGVLLRQGVPGVRRVGLGAAGLDEGDERGVIAGSLET